MLNRLHTETRQLDGAVKISSSPLSTQPSLASATRGKSIHVSAGITLTKVKTPNASACSISADGTGTRERPCRPRLRMDRTQLFRSSPWSHGSLRESFCCIEAKPQISPTVHERQKNGRQVEERWRRDGSWAFVSPTRRFVPEERSAGDGLRLSNKASWQLRLLPWLEAEAS